jgi:hypothetical protein
VTRDDGTLSAIEASNPLVGERLDAYVAAFDHDRVIESVLSKSRGRQPGPQSVQRRLRMGVLLPAALVVVAVASATGLSYRALTDSRHRNTFIVPSNLPAAARELETVARVTGPYGGTAIIAVGGVVPVTSESPSPSGAMVRVTAPNRCWRVSFSDGESLGTCLPLTKRKNPEYWVELQHLGSDTFVVVQAEPRLGNAITRIDFQLASGRVLSAKPIDGIVVFAIPRDELSTTKSQRGFLIGYDSAGRRALYDNNFAHVETDRQPVYYRSCPPGSGCG